jgi:CHASE1-domain containing sensor protein
MSRAAKATLVASIVVSSLTVWGVHYFQQQEHEVRAFRACAWAFLTLALY